MSNFLSKNKFKIVSALIAVGAAAVAKKMVDKQYEKSTGAEPPKNPEDENYNMVDVLIYTSATALLGAAVQVLARDLMTRQWKNMDGELPEELS